MSQAKENSLITVQIPIYVLLIDHLVELSLESGKLDVKRTDFKDLSSLCNHYSPNNKRLEKFDMPSDGSFFLPSYSLENIVKKINPIFENRTPDEIKAIIYQTLFIPEVVHFYLLAKGKYEPLSLDNFNLRMNLLGFVEGGLTMVSTPSHIQLGEESKAFAYGRKTLKSPVTEKVAYSESSVSAGTT